ncbi:GNAT family N-acetyltransferase [Pseudomonas quasicaspiana]|uniref:GNAT family N-acetyltransferase n=1 Tax=Pseudomonas quasicaspiana TaxID=2829821 RepID=UPI001E380A9D|nr:GNAT family N-acetyltransferase [Pseudomonas quasicaspiana]MCD5981158.1 GNAT family N-acetyltransferase [Pseudomonas quasicaspiana]
MSSAFRIERLQGRHAAAYRDLMLDAYTRHPEAFTSSTEERAALPLSWWENRLNAAEDAGQVVFGITDGDAVLGAVGLTFSNRQRARHKVLLFGMYVVAGQQGKGLGQSLIDAALSYARQRPHTLLVQLTVSENNASARKLYEHNGFASFGLEPLAVATATGFISKVHMWRELRES